MRAGEDDFSSSESGTSVRITSHVSPRPIAVEATLAYGYNLWMANNTIVILSVETGTQPTRRPNTHVPGRRDVVPQRLIGPTRMS